MSTRAENWRFRLPWTIVAIREDPTYDATGEKLATLICITRRGVETPPARKISITTLSFRLLGSGLASRRDSGFS